MPEGGAGLDEAEVEGSAERDGGQRGDAAGGAPGDQGGAEGGEGPEDGAQGARDEVHRLLRERGQLTGETFFEARC